MSGTTALADPLEEAAPETINCGNLEDAMPHPKHDDGEGAADPETNYGDEREALLTEFEILETIQEIFGVGEHQAQRIHKAFTQFAALTEEYVEIRTDALYD